MKGGYNHYITPSSYTVLCQPTAPLGGANTSGQLSAIPLYLKKVPVQYKPRRMHL